MRIKNLKLYLAELLELRLINFYKPPIMTKVGKREVISFEDNNFIRDSAIENTVEHFLHDLSEKNFSIIFCDGSLVQLYYELEKSEIVSHRYSYIPLPVPISDLRDVGNYEKLIRTSLQKNDIQQKSRIRFDFDKGQEDKVHPESHFTFISRDCRIPVRGGVSVRRFLRFIFANFVNNDFILENPSVFKLQNEKVKPFSDKWGDELHFNWRVRISSVDYSTSDTI